MNQSQTRRDSIEQVYDVVTTPTPKRSFTDRERGTTQDEKYKQRLSNIGQIQDEQLNHENGCSIRMMLLLSGPRLALQMAWAAQWAALGPYLENLLPSYAVQLTQFIGPLTGLVVAPTVGALSDQSQNKWGRRRPFLLFGAVTSAICWTLMGFTREIGESLGDAGDDRKWTAIFTIFFYTWMDITVNIAQTPAQLLIADFVGDRQTTGAAIGQAASTLGALCVAGYIQLFGAPSKTLHEFLGLLAAVMIISVGLVCIFVKETPLTTGEKKSACTNLRASFACIWEGIVQMPHSLRIFAIIFFTTQYGFTAYNGMKGQFFGLVVYDGSSERADICDRDNSCTKEQIAFNDGVQLAGGIADILFNVFGYFFSFAIPFLVHKFGSKTVMTIGLLPQALLMVMAFWHEVAVDVFIVMITSITQNIMFTLLVPTILHVISDQNSQLGVTLGALNSANCLGQFLNFLLSAALVNTSMGHALPVFLGGLMCVIGMIISIIWFKISFKSF